MAEQLAYSRSMRALGFAGYANWYEDRDWQGCRYWMIRKGAEEAPIPPRIVKALSSISKPEMGDLAVQHEKLAATASELPALEELAAVPTAGVRAWRLTAELLVNANFLEHARRCWPEGASWRFNNKRSVVYRVAANPAGGCHLLAVVMCIRG